MKKIVALIISIIMIFCVAGCDITSTSNNNYTQSSNSEMSESQNADKDLWALKAFEGTFSNSATTNSLLQAQITIDENGPAIFLYE